MRSFNVLQANLNQGQLSVEKNRDGNMQAGIY